MGNFEFDGKQPLAPICRTIGRVVKGNFHAQRVGPIFSSLDMVAYWSELFMHVNQAYSAAGPNKSPLSECSKARTVLPAFWLFSVLQFQGLVPFGPRGYEHKNQRLTESMKRSLGA